MIIMYKEQLVKSNDKCRYDDAAGEKPFNKNSLRLVKPKLFYFNFQAKFLQN